MTAPQEPELDEEGPDLDLDDPQAPTGLRAPLPRLPGLLRRQQTPTPPDPGPTAEPAESPQPQAAAAPTDVTSPRSSPASTEPAPAGKEPELVPPREMKAAIVQAADVAFVLVGQGVGTVVARARHNEKIAQQWVPTTQERELVLEPASRIVARHVTGTTETADLIDAALIAAGLGAFTVRASFGIEPLAPRKDDTQ